MKKLHSTLALLGLMFFAGCSLSTLNYNNEIVNQMKVTSSTVDTSSTTYNELVPDTVTEKTSIDTATLNELGDQIEDSIKDTQKLSRLESQNEEQQSVITPLLEAYLTAAQNYQAAYDAMLSYYGEGSYKTDITQVEAIDEALYSSYATFAEANNDLAEALEGFVQ